VAARGARFARAVAPGFDVKCRLQPLSSVAVAVMPDQVTALQPSRSPARGRSRRPLLNARALKSEVGIDAGIGVRVKDGGFLDPYRACLGIAAAAVDRAPSCSNARP